MNNFGNNNETSPHAEMDERIDQFLRGQMSKTDADAFRAEMKENTSLRERAITMARLIKQMQTVGEERRQRVVDAMQVVDKNTVQQIAQGKGEEMMNEKKPVVRRLMPWVAAAAVFCCVVLLGQFVMSPDGRSSIRRFASNFVSAEVNNTKQPVKAAVEKPKGAVRIEHDKLEELALLRGKVDMGLDLDETTERLRSIYEEAKENINGFYASYFDDIAYALAEGYHKIGDIEAETQILNDLLDTPEDNYISSK